MKRLLLMLGATLLIAPAFATAKPSGPSAVTLTSSCASACTMTEPQPGYYEASISFTGAGYTPGVAYAQCTSGPTSWCGGLYGSVDQSGQISFDIGAVHPGTYTTQVFLQSKRGLVAVSPPVVSTLLAP